jgi:hypothetical protein
MSDLPVNKQSIFPDNIIKRKQLAKNHEKRALFIVHLQISTELI